MMDEATVNRNALLEVVRGALHELNTLLAPEQQLRATEDTVLLGPGGRLDSLATVNLIMALEQRLCSELGLNLSLTGAEAVERWPDIFATVASLVDFLEQAAREHGRV